MGAVLAGLFVKPPRVANTTTQYQGVPMPTCMHEVITEDDIDGRDIVIIGDVHGCRQELVDLIGLIDQEYGSEIMYIFVGDLINKGPKNAETLKFIRELDCCYAVRGNHEERVIKEWLAVESGEISGFSAKYSWMSDLRRSDIAYIMELPYTIAIPSESIIVVHAGLSPWKHLYSQQPRHMITMRNIAGIDDLEPWESEKRDVGVAWASVWPGPTHVYFGHDARRRLQQYPYATGLDTGCLYGGNLTAVNITRPKPEFISVPAKQTHKVPGVKICLEPEIIDKSN